MSQSSTVDDRYYEVVGRDTLAVQALGSRRRFRIGTTGLALGPWSSNLYLVIEPG